MELVKAVRQVLDELDFFMENISSADYSRPVQLLNAASIGQHVRHILEFFICLNQGYESGVVDYDQRVRDKRIENDKQFARDSIRAILDSMDQCDLHQGILLQISYDRDGAETISIVTSYKRELAYNIEYSVHHMALIRIGIESINPRLVLPREFGVAVSTIRHQSHK